MRQVAHNIRTARRSVGHTQQSLAVALGLAERTVQGWEQCTALPSRKNLEALSALLGRDPGWFYTDHDAEPIAA